MDKTVQYEAQLAAWLDRHAIDARLLTGLPRVHTVAEAAQAMGVEIEQIAKSVVMNHQGTPLVVLAPGPAKVRDRLVIDRVGGARKELRMATADEVLQWTGYPVGGVPPIGHPRPLRTLMDQSLLSLPQVIFGGGSDTALLEIRPAVVRSLTNAEVGAFTT